MTFTVEKTIEVLERTPKLLVSMLSGISEEWTTANEGGDTWNVYEVVGHLIHGEKTDWMPRVAVILSDKTDKTFVPFDRFAQLAAAERGPLAEKLDEFAVLRNENLERLRGLNIGEQDLSRTGIHPALGEVTLSQLLATWMVHDLDHVGQISRIMATQYSEEVGPWKEYLRIVQK